MLTNPCKGLFHLKRREYKRIYESVNEISRNIHGPRIHAVYLSNDFNAAVTSRRYFGVFRRNILILGYPLLCSMGRKGLSGCLAHEIGHLKHNHFSVAGWLRIVQLFWMNIHLGILTFLFVPWLKYWLPALNFLALPVFRKHEKEADAYIVESLGGEYSAACQVELVLKSALYSDVLEDLTLHIREETWPQFDYAGYLRGAMRENLSAEKADKVLQRAMRTVDNVMDEHPSFADRLKLAGCVYPKQYAVFEADALDYFLAPDDGFYASWNAYIHKYYDPMANSYCEAIQQAQERLQYNPPSLNMDQDDIFNALTDLKTVGETQRRKEFLDDCLRVYPTNPQLRALQALDMAENEPDRAKYILEECIGQSPALCYLDEDNFLIKYYMETGDTERLKAYLKLRDGCMEKVQKSAKAVLSEKDDLESFELDANLKEAICETLQTKCKDIARAYSVKRSLDKNTSYYVFFLVLEFRLRTFRLGKSINEIIDELSATGFSIVIKNRSFCRKCMDKIPGACFYCRDTYAKTPTASAS